MGIENLPFDYQTASKTGEFPASFLLFSIGNRDPFLLVKILLSATSYASKQTKTKFRSPPEKYNWCFVFHVIHKQKVVFGLHSCVPRSFVIKSDRSEL
jgi:hypothetical protein